MRPAFFYYARAVGAEVHPRTGIHSICLSLEFQGIRPIIVPFAESYVASPHQREAEGLDNGHTLRILVFFLENRPEKGGVPLYVLPDDIGRAVGGGVVMHHHLEGEGGLLAYEAFQRIPDIGCLVIRKADDGYFGLIHR